MSQVDEFKVFKDFIVVLRNNYKPSLDKLVACLSETELKSLQNSMYVQKVRITTEKRAGKPEFRRLYKVKRLAELAAQQ